MKTEAERLLNSAHATLGHCGSKAGRRLTAKMRIDSPHAIRKRAFGTAQDYVRWAVALKELQFGTKAEAKSGRVAGITESLRFLQIWTAANALFARDEIMTLCGFNDPAAGEAVRFDYFYKHANVDKTLESDCLDMLHESLSMECKAVGVSRKIVAPKPKKAFLTRSKFLLKREIHVPDPKIRAHPKYRPNPMMAATPDPTMWEIIDQKYSRPVDRKRGVGRVIANALVIGEWPQPDASTLVYGARNWTVHGMLLTSFFRGSNAKYPSFIDNIQLLLAASIESFARQILPRV